VADPAVNSGRAHDLLSKRWSFFLLFALPVVAIIVTGNSTIHAGVRTAVWTAALAIMGTACTINAARCRRVHCYATGPFFLLMALITCLFGIGVLPLGSSGWQLIGLTILIGGIALCCLPELILGRYR